MKKLLFALLFAIPVMAQDGFRNENGSLIWQRVYPPTATMQELVGNNPELQVSVFSNDMAVGSAEKIKNTCQEGSSTVKNDFKFDFDIRKEGSNYLVTLTNIKIIEVMGPMGARFVANRCEKYFVDASKKVKKDARTTNDMNCVDSFLSDVFGGDPLDGSATLAAD